MNNPTISARRSSNLLKGNWMRYSLAIAAIFILISMASQAHAQLRFCNKTYETIWVAVNHHHNNDWTTEGWWRIEPNNCATPITENLRNRYYYYHANRNDDLTWGGGEGSIRRCVTRERFTIRSTENCSSVGNNARPVTFGRIDTGTSGSRTINLTSPSEPEVEVGELHSECLTMWDDSHQVHSVSLRGVRMKKLRHCIRITLTGPIDVKGVAKQYVNRCIDEGLNNQRTRYLLQLAASLGVDVLSAGSTGGATTIATVADWANSAANATVSCLTDIGQITDYVEERLRDSFEGSVRKESHWVYWWL